MKALLVLAMMATPAQADVRPVYGLDFGESDKQLAWGDTAYARLAEDLDWSYREVWVVLKLWDHETFEYVPVFALAKVPGRWIGRLGDECRLRHSQERGVQLVQLDATQ